MKAKLILVTSLALMLATAGSAMAAPGYGQGNGTGTCSGLTEQQRIERQASHDTNGDGVCDTPGAGGSGTGAFVDANGDGVCDVGGGTHPQDGSGLRHGGRTK
nr:hypothetical protein [uncultured Acetobacterium sp.]